MTELKCPFCGQELECCGAYIFGTKKLGCANCGLTGDSKLFSELIRTRKALDVAVDALKRIDETRSGVKGNLHATNGRTLNAGNGFCWATIDDIHNALKQITALEQKDVK